MVTNPDADKDLFQNTLLAYRREPGFWAGKRSEMPKPPAGFLAAAEMARPAAPLSYSLVLAAWKTEYARRFAEHVAKNGTVKTFHATAMQNPAERTKAVVARIKNLASGKEVKVTCSPGSTNPQFANDGEINNAEFWEGNGKDAWYQVDFGKPVDIATINVVPLHKDKRGYKFVVKTSMDAKEWVVQIDKRDNQDSFGTRGCEESFQLTPMRFIRVEMFGSDLNEGNHLVELIAK